MSSTELRKFMNLMESATVVVESEGEYYHEKDGDDWHVFHTDKGEGKSYSSHSEEGAAKADAAKRNGKVDESVEEDCDDEELDEAIVNETGNGNAQQKGINFSGTPAKKNSGDMDQKSPKSKPTGGKTPLAQTKSGTNVGQIKS